MHRGHTARAQLAREAVLGDEVENYIYPDNPNRMRVPTGGNPRDWTLEIHFVDRERRIGGFFEQLVTVE